MGVSAAPWGEARASSFLFLALLLSSEGNKPAGSWCLLKDEFTCNTPCTLENGCMSDASEGRKEVLDLLVSGHTQCSVSSWWCSCPVSGHDSDTMGFRLIFFYFGCQQGVLNPGVCRICFWPRLSYQFLRRDGGLEGKRRLLRGWAWGWLGSVSGSTTDLCCCHGKITESHCDMRLFALFVTCVVGKRSDLQTGFVKWIKWQNPESFLTLHLWACL